MVGTGIPKELTGKIVFIVLGLITIGLAILVAFSYTQTVLGELIDVPIEGEKARFMRYMACAIAMCEAENRQIDGDGCTGAVVEGWAVEYDEEGNKIKGCDDICDEVRDREEYDENGNVVKVCGQQSHYCQPECFIEYTFQEKTTYDGKHEISGSYIDAWMSDETCPGKSGFQTDASCLGGWADRGILPCGCMDCVGVGGVKPEGRLAKNTNGCGLGDEVEGGTIWISNDLAGKCVEDYIPDISNGLSKCTFEPGDTIKIYADDPSHTKSDCSMFLILKFCTGFISTVDHYCPQIAICPMS